jgi:hypothetical protein
MNYNFLTVFFILSIINVIFATIKSLVTINGGKLTASLISGGYFAFYNIMMQYTVADFPMWQKCVITFVCNVVGVYLVKWGEEKGRKDKLWKVEATIPNQGIDPKFDDCIIDLENSGLSFNYIDINKYLLINIYCETQAESTKVKEILDRHSAKYFVSESKTLY